MRTCNGKANFDWTDERIEQLKKWWAEGYRASDMAASFTGITRSAVLGKVHRLKLTKRKKPRQERALRNSVNGAVKRQTVARWRRDGTSLKLFDATTGDVPKLATDHCPNPTGLIELTTKTCRWPVFGEGANTVFCGDQAIGRFPYCLHHCRIAYRAPERRTPEQRAAIKQQMASAIGRTS